MSPAGLAEHVVGDGGGAAHQPAEGLLRGGGGGGGKGGGVSLHAMRKRAPHAEPPLLCARARGIFAGEVCSTRAESSDGLCPLSRAGP